MATGRANHVAVVDLASLKAVKYIPVGKRVWGVALTPDGKKLYAANGLSSNLSVIDTLTNRVIGTVPTGKGPWGVVVDK